MLEHVEVTCILDDTEHNSISGSYPVETRTPTELRYDIKFVDSVPYPGFSVGLMWPVEHYEDDFKSRFRFEKDGEPVDVSELLFVGESQSFDAGKETHKGFSIGLTHNPFNPDLDHLTLIIG